MKKANKQRTRLSYPPPNTSYMKCSKYETRTEFKYKTSKARQAK